jgi:polar amino acid transport system substrate-binding protein
VKILNEKAMQISNFLITSRRGLFSILAVSALLLAGCSTTAQPPPKPDPQTVSTLAPTGTLRVGVYRGSPSSLVTTPQGDSAGVAHDLGVLLAKRLDVPVQVVTFDRLALVLEALKAGAVDVTFTNASPAHNPGLAFALPLLSMELGYLVPVIGQLQSSSAREQTGMHIGTFQRHSIEELRKSFPQTEFTAYVDFQDIQEALNKNKINAFAAEKDFLYFILNILNKDSHAFREMRKGFESATVNSGIAKEDVDRIFGYAGDYKVLEGRWGLTHMGMAIPKERAAALPFVQSFGQALKQSGELQKIATKAGLRGLVEKE